MPEMTAEVGSKFYPELNEPLGNVQRLFAKEVKFRQIWSHRQ